MAAPFEWYLALAWACVFASRSLACGARVYIFRFVEAWKAKVLENEDLTIRDQAAFNIVLREGFDPKTAVPGYENYPRQVGASASYRFLSNRTKRNARTTFVM